MSLQLDPSMEALVLEPPSEPTIEKINFIVQLVGISGLDDETASIYLEVTLGCNDP